MSSLETNEILLAPPLLGSLLVEGVKTIDKECSDLINGREAGLCNVKRQFRLEAVNATKKSLTEETLISWRLQKRLLDQGLTVSTEVPYPADRKKCDLVIEFPDKSGFWIEVKLAWKTWFNCTGTVGRSGNYKGYLFGDSSHPGTAHDFKKLEGLARNGARRLGVLLIGFDSLKWGMWEDVEDLALREKLAHRGWALAHQDAWQDRRNEEFRINCWFWSREPV